MTSGIPGRMLALFVLLAASAGAQADWGALNMTTGVTELSREVQALHMTIFYICVAIGVAVFGVMFYSIFAHRKSNGKKPAEFHESTKVEIVWTVIPLIILIAMAVPAAKTLIKMEDFSGSEMSIRVTGFQWRWHYEYLDDDIEFYSQLDPEHNQARQMGANIDLEQFDHYIKEVDNPLVVPVGKKIRFLHTAADVLHSWWVPDLAVKKDAIPGFINENWALIEQPGTYRGKCAELCGRDHGFMPIVVEALPQEEYDAWVADKKEEMAAAAGDAVRDWQQDELVATGEHIYQANCMSCHQREGQGIPGLFPAIAGSDIATGSVDAHAATVLHGVENTTMQAFSKRLSDTDLAAVITYQRNAFGNDTGDSVQPRDIRELRLGTRQSALGSELSPALVSSTSGVN